MSFKVGFLIVGAQKAGTTALHEYLKMHSLLGMPECKEVHFFDRDELSRSIMIIITPFLKGKR